MGGRSDFACVCARAERLGNDTHGWGGGTAVSFLSAVLNASEVKLFFFDLTVSSDGEFFALLIFEMQCEMHLIAHFEWIF